MWPRMLLLAGFGLLMTGAAHGDDAHGDDAYTIKLRVPQPGDSYWIEVASTTKGSGKVVDQEGNPLFEKGGKHEDTAEAYRETVLTVKDGKLASFRREYKSGHKKIGDKTEDFPFLGKAIVIEKRSGKCSFHLENGPQLLGKDAAPLEAEFNENDIGDDGMEHYLPGKPVRVNDSWPIKKSPALQRLNNAQRDESRPQIDESRVEGTATLLRVYKKDSLQFGVIKVTCKYPCKPGDLVQSGERLQLQPGSHLAATMVLDACIDGSLGPGQYEVVIHMNLDFTLPNLTGDALRLKMTGQSTTHRKWRK